MRALCTKGESFARLLDEEECYRQLRRLRWPDGVERYVALTAAATKSREAGGTSWNRPAYAIGVAPAG